MNKTQKTYTFLGILSLLVIFFLPAIIYSPYVLPYLSEPTNPGLSLFYLAEGFAFFALAFFFLTLAQNKRGGKGGVPPFMTFIVGLVVIYAGHAKLLCDLNETNFFVYLAGILLLLTALFEKLVKK